MIEALPWFGIALAGWTVVWLFIGWLFARHRDRRANMRTLHSMYPQTNDVRATYERSLRASRARRNGIQDVG